ncbi:MAG: hypothetical protein FWE48_07340 [Coriobacteriia bacterium]|nr:hypothetical protein [Coriobacteriia bacterium]
MSNNNVLATVIIDVIPNMDGLAVEIRKELGDIDFAPLSKGAEEAVSNGISSGLSSDSFASLMSFTSSAITIGKFLDDEVRKAIGAVRTSLGELGPTLSTGMGTAFKTAGKGATQGMGLAFESLSTKTRDLGNSLKQVIPNIKAKTKASALWIKTNTLKAASFLKLKAAMMATTIKTKALALATKLATAAQKIFNLVMKANPVGLVIAAIAALVAGLALFFTQTETGRGVWQQLTAAFSLAGDAIGVLIDWFRDAISSIRENEQVMNILKKVFVALKGSIGAIGVAVASLVAPFVNVRVAQQELERATEAHREATERLEGAQNSLHDTQNRLTNAQFAATDAQFALEDAQARLNEVIEKYGEDSEEARRATHELDKAQHRLAEANERVETAANEVVEAYEYQKDAAKEAEQTANGLAEASDNLAVAQYEAGKAAKAWKDIKNAVRDTWTSAGEWISDLGDSAREMWNGTTERTREVWNTVTSSLRTAWSTVGEVIHTGISTVVSTVSGSVSRMASAAGTMMSGLLEGIKTGAINAVSRIRELAGDLVEAIRGFKDRMRNVATALINGLIQGIANGAQRVTERMRQLARDALAAAKRIFGINSPSREFAKIGTGICDGLVQGLNGGVADVIKAVCDIADAVTDAFEVSTAASINALYSGVDSFGSGTGRSFVAAGAAGVGNTYLTFNTPVTGYHEVLAANRSAQRKAARR